MYKHSNRLLLRVRAPYLVGLLILIPTHASAMSPTKPLPKPTPTPTPTATPTPTPTRSPLPPPIPATEGPITSFGGNPGIVQNEGIDWCHPDVFVKPDPITGENRYWIHETAVDYRDPRPRYYYVDFDPNMSGSPAGAPPQNFEYGPLQHGGFYQIICMRYSGKFWESGSQLESHTVTLSVPGPLNESTGFAPPETFQLGSSFMDLHTSILPPFEPLAGKIFPAFRFSLADDASSLRSRGANFFASPGLPGVETSERFLTTNMNAGVYGRNLDAIGQQGFLRLSNDQIDDLAHLQDDSGYFISDLELSPDSGDNPDRNYWSNDLEGDALVQKMYRLYGTMKKINPNRKIGDVYRSVVWSNSFLLEGRPAPQDPRWKLGLAHPETLIRPTYRSFKDVDGITKSLLDVTDVTVIDCYPKGVPSDEGNVPALEQIYANVYDTLIVKRARPDVKAIWYSWQQSRFRTNPEGYSSKRRTAAHPTSFVNRCPRGGPCRYPSWARSWETEFTSWHDQIPSIDDVNRLVTGDDVASTTTWEPSFTGAPSPFIGADSGNRYPRVHNYPIMYGKLGEYQAKRSEPVRPPMGIRFVHLRGEFLSGERGRHHSRPGGQARADRPSPG